MARDVAGTRGAECLLQLTIPGRDLVTSVHQQRTERDDREHGHEKEFHTADLAFGALGVT